MEYSSSAALLQYLHGEEKVPTATVGDSHSLVNNNDDDNDDDDDDDNDATCYERLSSYT